MDHCSKPASQVYLAHHGIKGQRWGVRRYQNPDGTLTEKGKARLEKKDNDWIDKRSAKITEAAKSISTTSAPASQISAPRVSVSKPSSSVPPPYSFDSLIRQNDDLLKKMLAELA